MRTLLLILLAACGAVDPAPTATADPSRRPSLSLAGRDPIEGLPMEIGASIHDVPPGAELIVLASTATGAGPCDPRTAVSLQIVGPLVQVTRQRAREGGASLRWTPPAALHAGDVLHLQAGLLHRGALRLVSQVVDAEIDAAIVADTPSPRSPS